MPDVLWGVACLSLPGPTTAADVIHEFREALSVRFRGASAGVSGIDKNLPRVDLYRLVRIDDQVGCRLGGEEQVVAHLPDSTWGCREIEEMNRQCDETELRYKCAQESLISLMESLDFGEVSHSPPSSREDASQALSMHGLPKKEQNKICSVLRQENKMLRYKLSQREALNEELKETAEMLRREFMALVRDIMPPPGRPRAQVANSAGPSHGQRPTVPVPPIAVKESPSKFIVAGPSSPRSAACNGPPSQREAEDCDGNEASLSAPRSSHAASVSLASTSASVGSCWAASSQSHSMSSQNSATISMAAAADLKRRMPGSLNLNAVGGGSVEKTSPRTQVAPEAHVPLLRFGAGPARDMALQGARPGPSLPH